VWLLSVAIPIDMTPAGAFAGFWLTLGGYFDWRFGKYFGWHFGEHFGWHLLACLADQILSLVENHMPQTPKLQSIPRDVLQQTEPPAQKQDPSLEPSLLSVSILHRSSHDVFPGDGGVTGRVTG